MEREQEWREKVNTANALQYALFLVVITLLVKPAGTYMAHVFNDEHTWFDPILKPIERVVYRLIGINPKEDMTWTRYAGALLIFSLAGTLLLYALLRGQTHLPYYHAAEVTTPMTPDLAMNTAVSFSTTSTWQAYSGESAMTYWSQMAGLCAQNFLGGAAGFAVGVAFIRGLARQGTGRIGNFWVDLTRSLLWVLLPIALVGSVALIWQGVPQNFAPYTKITTLEGAGQTIAQGPVAALEFIKNLGTNGGGFFGANGAHPFENPTPLANFIEMLAISILPAAFTYTFGRMTGNVRQGWTLFGVMVFLFALGTVCCDVAERHNAPQVAALHIGTDGNMEGKEARFGVGASVLDAINTSNTATGSTNSMHDSYTPLGVMIPLINMLLGEIVFGGLGTGLFSIIMIALIGLFISGLMIGRTPEYLGKKIGVNEIKLVMIYTLIIPATVLILVRACRVHAGGAGRADDEHGRAWVYRDRVRVCVIERQQRAEHGGSERELAVLQHHDGDSDDGGTLRPDDPRPGPGRVVIRAATPACKPGNPADRYSTVRGRCGRCGLAGGRIELLSRTIIRACRGAFCRRFDGALSVGDRKSKRHHSKRLRECPVGGVSRVVQGTRVCEV